MTVASDLSQQLETATDAYAVACDVTAVKENEWLRAYARGFAIASAADVAATIRPKTAENGDAAVEARAAWNLAQAHERACRAKVEELKARLMAALSHQRFVREQT